MKAIEFIVGSRQCAVGSRGRVVYVSHPYIIIELLSFIHILFNPAYCLLPTAYYSQPGSYSSLLTAYCPLPTAYFSPTTSHSS